MMLNALRNTPKPTYFALFVLLSLTLFALLRTAWICDDAAITLRTVLNFINGYGATYNIDERVQAYTHPLWFLLLSIGTILSGNVYIAAFALPILTTLVFMVMLTVNFKHKGLAIAGLLLLSKAFLDFSTSGLENPLSHVLLLLSLLAAIKAKASQSYEDLRNFFLLCGLTYLCHPDLPLLLLPLAFALFLNSQCPGDERIRAGFVGSIPVLVWTAFSLFYYGFPFANTAYAKLGADIPEKERLVQGTVYLQESLRVDPITLFIIFSGFALGFIRPTSFTRCLSIGLVLYMFYLCSIGGDFMSGRLLTPPLVIAAFILIYTPLPRKIFPALICMALCIGIFNIKHTLLSGPGYSFATIPANGISDERGFYYPSTGLFSNNHRSFAPPPWEKKESRFFFFCGIGFFGIDIGPGQNMIDQCGLADPLLARLPATRATYWRIGHFFRQMPTDYGVSLQKGENIIHDPAMRKYYNSIRLITRGPLLSLPRLAEIIRFNLGFIEKPPMDIYRFGFIEVASRLPEIPLERISTAFTSNSWLDPRNIDLTLTGGIVINLGKPTRIHSIELTLDNNDSYSVEYLHDGYYRPLAQFGPSNGSASVPQYNHKFSAPLPLTDRIRVKVIGGDGMFALGYLRINAD